MPSALLSAPPEAAARPPRPHRVLAFAQGLSAHRAGHPLFPTVCRQDETSSRSIGKHELEIQGQRIDLIVVTAYGESNELVAEVDRPRLIVENVDSPIDRKIEGFLETLLLVAAADGPELGSQSLCGQHRMQSRARHRIFDQYLLDAIPLKASLRGVEHLDGLEARPEHVHDVVSVSVSGNDQEDGIVGCCGLLDGGVDRNEYSGGAGRAGVDWNQILRLDQLTAGRCRILLPLRREYRFSIFGANFLDLRLGETLGQQYVSSRPPPLVVPEFVRLLLGDQRQAENVPPAFRQKISRK